MWMNHWSSARLEVKVLKRKVHEFDFPGRDRGEGAWATRTEARNVKTEGGYKVRIIHSVNSIENRHDHMVPLL